MRVLIACERSGAVRRAFRERGHDAWSCDLAPSEDGDHFHYQTDVLQVLYSQHWDLMIGHPTCTRLANSGVLRLYVGGKKTNGIDPVKWAEMEAGAEFFAKLWNAPIAQIAIENPIMHCHGRAAIGKLPKPQIIQPFQFGHPESKSTCLWLKNLPPLRPTKVLPLLECGHWENQTPSGQNKLGPSTHRAIDRARTYSGIAQAMAEQ